MLRVDIYSAVPCTPDLLCFCPWPIVFQKRLKEKRERESFFFLPKSHFLPNSSAFSSISCLMNQPRNWKYEKSVHSLFAKAQKTNQKTSSCCKCHSSVTMYILICKITFFASSIISACFRTKCGVLTELTAHEENMCFLFLLLFALNYGDTCNKCSYNTHTAPVHNLSNPD